MLSLNTILHPTDFSEQSDYAFRLACSLARDHGAKLVLLHALPMPYVAYEGMVVAMSGEEERTAAQNRLDALARQASSGLTIETQIGEARDASVVILDEAEELDCSLIVMGTHGRTGISRLLLGSTAEKVLRGAPCPVLTVKSPVPNLRPVAEPAAEFEAAR